MIPLSVPNLRGNELRYVTRAIEEEWVSTAGPYIEEFESCIAEYVNCEGAVSCQSGTAGLHLALQTVGVCAGEEVLVPTLTFIASVNPVRYIGAEPVFMDCDSSLTIDPMKVRNFCENECYMDDSHLINKKTGRFIRAILVVHVFGNMADMESLMNIAEAYHLKVVEDAAEALGTYYTDGKFKGKYAGTIGDIGVFSFNGNKIITTGGGGMIVSWQEELLKRCRHLSTQAKADMLYFDHDEIGYNYRMTNIQAALGLAQLEQLEGFIQVKKENYFLYKEKGLLLLGFRDNIRPNYWFYSYMTENRDELLEFLGTKQIQTRPVWKLIHTLKPYKGAETYCIERAPYYYDRILNLPCSTNLKKEDAAYTANLIHSRDLTLQDTLRDKAEEIV